jgi:23S rRNA (guanosine2251-2'-O)-methyltransferase
VCVVLGAEGRGLSRLVRERCDEVVAIPMAGALDSLNVAAAAALACFEVARRR